MNITAINTKARDNQGSISGAGKTDGDKQAGRLCTQAANKPEGVQVLPGIEPADAGTYAEIMDRKTEKAKEDGSGKTGEQEEDLKETAGRMSEEDYMALTGEGMSLEYYEMGRLDRALERIKENKEYRAENVDGQVEARKEYREVIKKISIANKIPDPIVKKVAQKLAEADMPVTEENIMSMVNAFNMSGAVHGISQGGTAYMIDNGLEPTIENIYHSQYSGYRAGTSDKAGWETVKDQAAAVLDKAGMEVNEKTMDQAKWLYSNDLPVTRESMEALQRIENIKENVSPDYILDKMAEAMGQGLKPEEASLDEGRLKTVEEAILEFDRITEDFYKTQDFTDIDEVTFKRQLEEVRLKLTAEAGLKLLNKGITLDTSNLQKIVEGLKEMEDQYYKGMVDEAGIASEGRAADILKDTVEKVDGLKVSPAYILGATITGHGERNLDDLHKEAIGMKVRLDKAGDTYEALMTAPRKDMGDSITKAFANIDELLKDMGLDTTAANQRAVRILAYNQMEINQDSVKAVKEYDSKVNMLLSELKPQVTVELIRRDINPLEIPLDQLTEQVREIREEIGASDGEKYSKFLWKLEREDGISAEERKSYIGIYRLLNNVEKTNGAAIGAVVNNGMELTLKNLLTAARSRKSQGINVEVDESFGGTESISFKGESITDQIDAGYVKYQQEVIQRIMDHISPARLNQLTKDGLGGLMDMTLEKIEDKLEQAVEDNRNDKAYAFQMTEKLRGLAKTSREAVTLLESYNIETTIRNVQAAGEYLTGTKNFFKEMDELADNEYSELIAGLPDALEDAQTMEDRYEQVEAKVKQLITEEYKNQVDSSEKADKLQLLGAGIELARKLSHSQHYEIPVVTGEQVTKMSLTVLQGTKDSGRLHITMDFGDLGKAEAEFTVKEQAINGFILCETKDGLETITGCMDQLKSRLSGLGLEAGQLNAGVTRKAADIFIKTGERNNNEAAGEASENKARTKVLYQAAKAVVQTIGTAVQNRQI